MTGDHDAPDSAGRYDPRRGGGLFRATDTGPDDDGTDLPPPLDPIGLGDRLALNKTGTFDWDLDRETLELDACGLEVFDLRPDEYDGRPASLAARIPPEEGYRLDAAVSQAVQDGAPSYGVYFRVHCRDGTPRWTHTQGHLLRDGEGRLYRIVGLVREAGTELADSVLLRSLQENRQRQIGRAHV